MLFVNNTHLRCLCKGTMFAAIMLDVDNDLFDIAYAIAASNNNDEWL